MYRRLIVAFIALAAALVIDAEAAQAAIVYVCSSNLCRVNSDGTGQTQLTTDGSDAGPAYGEPSLSADGSKLAYAKANRAYVAARIPHLERLLGSSPEAVVAHGETLVVGAAPPEVLDALGRADGRAIVDLVRFSGSDALEARESYSGIAW